MPGSSHRGYIAVESYDEKLLKTTVCSPHMVFIDIEKKNYDMVA